MNKITTIIGLSFAVFFLIGLATTLTRSMMIGFLDVIPCLLYTSDAADDLLCVDLGGRRIIKK